MSFTIAYVPTVEEVDVVHLVERLPHPYFPLKKYNYQEGGALHITPLANLYQAVYTPQYNCEFKGLHMTLSAYNIEDTYDVKIGPRYVIKNSHVKEMSEFRYFETYEVVNAGTPITIDFWNNSYKEKHLLYDIITLIDSTVLNTSTSLTWNFNWSGETYYLPENDTCTLIISKPDYVNLDSKINSATMQVLDKNTGLLVATIDFNSNTVTSDYVENITELQPLNLLGRVNLIGITDVTFFDDSVHIIFKNVNSIGDTDPHPIEIQLVGQVTNVNT